MPRPLIRGPYLALLLLALVTLGYIAAAAFHVAFGPLNVDEGFYAAAARAVWQGEVPYRDFGFTQPPLLPYVDGFVLGLTRFGLFEQRIVNGVWGALALVIGARLLARRCGLGPAALFVAVFALTPAWLYNVHLGKTYGLLSLLVMLSATVYLENPRGPRRCIILSVLAVLGIGCRLPSLPFFAALWLGALLDDKRPHLTEIGAAIGSLFVAAALVLLPFYLAAPEASVFWTVDFHRISVPAREWRLTWQTIAALAPVVWGIVAFAVARATKHRAWPRRETILIGAGLLALATNCLPQGAYQEYGVPFLPPLALGGLLLALKPGVTWSPARGTLAAVTLVLLSFAVGPALSWPSLAQSQRTFPSAWLPLNAPPYDFGLAANVRNARATVQRLLPPDQPFIGPNLILAIEANRPIPRRLRMSSFSLTEDFSPEQADRLHLLTFTELRSMLLDIDVTVVGFMQTKLLNYAWSVPSFHFPDDHETAALHRLVNRYFVTVHNDRNFAVLARPHILPLVPP
jgi:hypothetical protein